ncbi:nucleotide sugar dehydrogenase, partial [Flavobacteriaceae bacterium]|nr:nucleotide sugar dehydrogenase [Flavobacteriaceae bacterium]
MNFIMKVKIGIIGLGYVGLPLAVEFSNKFKTVGYDINEKRINELNNGVDSTLEVSTENLNIAISNNLFLSSKIDDIIHCNFYIITVPTPTNKNNSPDLRPLLNATKTVGNILKKGDIVVYESTVYPGCTEEDCLPILEDNSKLKINEDFFIGYSPERINPGDKDRTVSKIVKLTSGSNSYSANLINDVYSEIIVAGTYLAPSIKIAEAAKVIENSQRDINIAFVNELSKIFSLLNI